MKHPNAGQLAVLVDEVCEDIGHAVTVLPLVADHAKRERQFPHPEGLPVAGIAKRCAADECDGRPHDGLPGHAENHLGPNEMDCADPVGETVVSLRSLGKDEQRLAHGDAVLAEWMDDFFRLRESTRRVLDQLPAVTTSVRANRQPTDGTTEDDRQRARTGATEAESACAACELGVSVVGPLTAMLCDVDLQAWVDDGCPRRGAQGEDKVTGVVFWTGWIGRRRAQLAETAAGVTCIAAWDAG
ncbi:MAG: hypothetical protein M3Y91_14905 [Actinomycetota bacterium]|nr:hypothetical protein [Actinomycetota bacterium]